MAKTVALSDPKAGTSLGATFIGAADRLDFGADLLARTKLFGPGSDVAEAVARGKADLGVTLIGEMRHPCVLDVEGKASRDREGFPSIFFALPMPGNILADW